MKNVRYSKVVFVGITELAPDYRELALAACRKLNGSEQQEVEIAIERQLDPRKTGRNDDPGVYESHPREIAAYWNERIGRETGILFCFSTSTTSQTVFLALTSLGFQNYLSNQTSKDFVPQRFVVPEHNKVTNELIRAHLCETGKSLNEVWNPVTRGQEVMMAA